jgi:multiple sugar transport system ATP-binding protein
MWHIQSEVPEEVTMANIVLEQLNKVYPNGFHAVYDADLNISDGEFMVLVGPSGCGKTTLLRMIAGLEDITSGKLEIGGKVVNDLGPRERDVAMVFQNYALYPHMTVAENIGFALKLQKMPKDQVRAKVEEAAHILGLTEWLERKPGQLSGGQRQRVAMGRAIVRQPSVFLMDEPLSNLDAQLRVKMRAEVSRIARRIGVATLYVTHDQIEAMTMADRIAVLNLGVLEQAGTPRELYESPANRFVAGFIGSPAMNFVDMTVSDASDSLDLATPDGTISAALTDTQAAAVRRLGSRTVVLGVRPEHLELGATGDGRLSVTAVVDVTEFLGNDMLIYASSAGHDIVAVISASEQLKVGDKIVLSAAPEHVYLFDPASGASLGVA